MKLPIPKMFAVVFAFLVMAGGITTFAQTKRDEAWEILRANVNERETQKRVQAVRVLGLLPGNPEALGLAQKAVEDEKPEV